MIAFIAMSPNSFLLANLCLYFNFFLDKHEAGKGFCFEPSEQAYCSIFKSVRLSILSDEKLE